MKKRKTKSSSSSTKKLADYSYLPPELLSEVLARVAVKPLMKFRCVSKTWCSLIDSSDFISMHRKLYNNSGNNTQLLLVFERCLRKGSVITVRRSDIFWKISNIGTIPKSCFILQTCNGLTLIQSRDYSKNNYENVLRLWNPCIRKCLILPKSPLHDDYGGRYVLGFAPSSNDYKVLAFWKDRAIVYSLNDHCWRVIANPTGVEVCVGSWPGLNGGNYAFSGSTMYWVGTSYGNTHEALVLCFDFDVEEFKSIKLPDAVKLEESKVWFIFTLSGSIAVFTMTSENICIWILEKDGGEDRWRLWFSSELYSDACKFLPSVDGGIYHLLSNATFVQKSNTFLMVMRRSKVMSYNITTQQVQHLGKSIRGRISFDPYVESLVLHKGLEGQNLTSFP